jgi:ATP-dependent helicase HrpB
MSYPVEAVLNELLDGLAQHHNAVLIAPPGAGKTTLVAPAMLRQTWCTAKILLLSPRRIAAGMAAERIAELTGETVGQTIGYATRMDSKQSDKTRILVLTEGIFRNQIIADPELTGVSAVLFDEVHERSIDSDFGLALALESQAAFRPDLRLIAMSATLDGDRFSALMHDAPIVRSEGKNWPLVVRYSGRRAELPIEQDIARVIKQALNEEDGDVLTFLPGVREIERTMEKLGGLSPGICVYPLHGSLDPVEQRLALRPDKEGRRKIILATNIAETSLTIDGVRLVIDSGLARRARYDKAASVTRLVTERASLSAATQRAGRAARQGSGIAYRLWEEAGNGGLPPFDPPEILESDLAPLLLDCAIWGEGDPTKLCWLDTPPESALAEARKALLELSAIDDSGRVTPHGLALAKLPLPPHLANMVVRAAEYGQAKRAATLAVLIQERGLGGNSDDLETRLERFEKERGPKHNSMAALANRLATLAQPQNNKGQGDSPLLSAGVLIAFAYPNRIAKRRDAKGESWISAMGRGLRLDPLSALISSDWLAVAEIQGAASNARILSAASISIEEIETHFADHIKTDNILHYDSGVDRVISKTRRSLGAILLAEGQGAKADFNAIAMILEEAMQTAGLNALNWGDAAIALRKRAAFAGEISLSDAALLASTKDWLLPLLHGVTRLRDVPSSSLYQALENLLGWDAKQAIDKVAPRHFYSPAGTLHEIDYAAEAGPCVELRVQALFGMDAHPVVGVQKIPLVLSLTSPAGRPIQTTRDLPAFWRGSWHDVAKEMRGRYPKHNWPDAPWDANASLKTKKAQSRDA